MLLENRFTLTNRKSDLCLKPFVTVKKPILSRAVTPRWLEDAKECIQSGWSKQCDCCSPIWHTKSRPQMLVASKAAFLENYLAIGTWILNGSSIECHEKKHQPFSLSGVRFGRVHTTLLTSMCRAMPFSARALKKKTFSLTLILL